jgi:hypothetical protein
MAIELHQSMLGDIWGCPFRWHLINGLGLSLRDEPGYFAEGRLYHLMLAHWRNPVNVEKYRTEERYDRLRAKLEGYAKSSSFGTMGDAVEAAWRYFDAAKRKDEIEPLAVQFIEPFLEARIPGYDDFVVGGTPDGIVEAYGKVWTVEYKTARVITSKYFSKLTQGYQSGFYYLLTSENYESLHIDPKRIGGTIFEVVAKTKDNEVRREQAVASRTTYERCLRYIVDSMNVLRHLFAEGKWPRNLDECFGKFDAECAFMPWCSRGGKPSDLHEDLLGTVYTVKLPAERQKEKRHEKDFYDL